MSIDILEKTATLEVMHFSDGYTECTKFNFAIPVSGDYEVDIDQELSSTDAYPRYINSVEMKYIHGILYLCIECNDEEGFDLSVKDSKHAYRAICYGSKEALDVWKEQGMRNKAMKQIETDGIEVYIKE